MDIDIYADLISNISIKNGVVRLDLVTEAPPAVRQAGTAQGLAGGESEAAYVFTKRLVMPLVGFIQSYPMFEELFRQIKEKGLLQAAAEADGQGEGRS